MILAKNISHHDNKIIERPRARIGLAGLGPKVVCLSGHHDVFQCRLKQGDTVKVTVGIRLK